MDSDGKESKIRLMNLCDFVGVKSRAVSTTTHSKKVRRAIKTTLVDRFVGWLVGRSVGLFIHPEEGEEAQIKLDCFFVYNV